MTNYGAIKDMILNATEPKPVYWCGELKDECNTCLRSFGSIMYDARTRSGQWGNLCQACFRRFANGLGTGKGQMYAKQADGRWLKTGG